MGKKTRENSKEEELNTKQKDVKTYPLMRKTSERETVSSLVSRECSAEGTLKAGKCCVNVCLPGRREERDQRKQEVAVVRK